MAEMRSGRLSTHALKRAAGGEGGEGVWVCGCRNEVRTTLYPCAEEGCRGGGGRGSLCVCGGGGQLSTHALKRAAEGGEG